MSTQPRRLSLRGKKTIRTLLGSVLLLLLVCGVGVTGFYALPLVRCGLAPYSTPLQTGDSYRALQSGGHKRCYLLHVPASYRAGQAVPLVMSLHGFMGDPYDLRRYARWEETADMETFLVAYPQGSSFPLRWNVGPGAHIDDVDDVLFIQDLIAEIATITELDPQRIFVSGFSNGGGKASQVGCALADQVAAIGVVASLGPDYPGGCHPVRPLPVIAFFGMAEAYGAPPPEGFSLWLQNLVFNLSIEKMLPGPATPLEWIQAWAVRNSCAPEPVQVPVSANVVAVQYVGCNQDAGVVLYLVGGMGHAWPGGPPVPIPGMGDSTSEIDASRLLWEFFSQHPMPE